MTGTRRLSVGCPNVGGELSDDAVQFGAAVLREQRRLGVLRLSVPLLLWVAKQQGYRKVAEPRPIRPYAEERR